MSSNVSGVEEWHATTLRAWQLAILRFAVTLDQADRLALLAIAGEIDGLGPQYLGKSDFGFFRRTSEALCTAMLQPNEFTAAVLRQHLARIDDERLKPVFAAAVEIHQPTASVSRIVKRNDGLWKGLSSPAVGYPRALGPAEIPRCVRPKTR